MSAFDATTPRHNRTIDLNADLGEGFPNDARLLTLVSSASISCGAHAGDPETIRQALRWARQEQVTIGAHPGYPDREGFGRRAWQLGAGDVEKLIREQAAALMRIAETERVLVRFLKPHGALYNQAQRQPDTAEGVVRAALELQLALLGQPGTVLEALATERGVRFIAEGFPDRRTCPDGSLVPRTEPGAVLHELADIAAQVERLLGEGRVATLCLHGDEPAAAASAQRVREIVTRSGLLIRSFLA